MKHLWRALIVSLVLIGCSQAIGLDSSSTDLGDWAPVFSDRNGLEGFATTEGSDFRVETVSGQRSFVAGVNLGPTIPGRFPGEQAIRREDFRRWFPQMADLGVRAIRVYTIMHPTSRVPRRRGRSALKKGPCPWRAAAT